MEPFSLSLDWSKLERMEIILPLHWNFFSFLFFFFSASTRVIIKKKKLPKEGHGWRQLKPVLPHSSLFFSPLPWRPVSYVSKLLAERTL